MPMSQVQASLAWSPLSITSSPAEAPSGTRTITKRIGADHHRCVDVADGDAGPVRRLAKPLPRTCKFAAGDGGRGRDLRDLRPAVR